MDIVTDWAYQKNRWYDALPYHQQFLTAFWSAILGLALILIICLYTGAPFGLLVGAAVLFAMIPRCIYCFGFMHPSPWLPAAPEGPSTVRIPAPDWVFSLNRWFDAKPSHERPLILAAATLALFAFNMLLHGVLGFPFALLFLLVAWVIGAYRVGWHYGWLVPRTESTAALPAPAGMSGAPATASPVPATVEPG